MDKKQGFGGTRYLALLLKIEESTINRWVKEGMPKHARATYYIPDCIEWYVRNKARGVGGGDETKQASQARLVRAKADKAEFENQVLRGRYMETKEAERQFCEGFGAVRSAIDNVPAKTAPRVCNTSREEAEEILEEEMEAVMDRIREWADMGGDE